MALGVVNVKFLIWRHENTCLSMNEIYWEPDSSHLYTSLMKRWQEGDIARFPHYCFILQETQGKPCFLVYFHENLLEWPALSIMFHILSYSYVGMQWKGSMPIHLIEMEEQNPQCFPLLPYKFWKSLIAACTLPLLELNDSNCIFMITLPSPLEARGMLEYSPLPC